MTRALLYIVVSLIACTPEKPSGCPSRVCAEFLTHEEAQSAFDKDPACLASLDGDKDGLACEALPSAGINNNPGTGSSPSGTSDTGITGNSGCPTTANCGCSNIRKADCESSRCCKWVVGLGCKCKS